MPTWFTDKTQFDRSDIEGWLQLPLRPERPNRREVLISCQLDAPESSVMVGAFVWSQRHFANVSSGSSAAVAGTLMAQPVYPQLRK